MATIISAAGVILERTALIAGLLAATIAIGGFLTRARALLRGAVEQAELQRPTAVGGMVGLAFGVVITLLDAIVG